MLQVAPCQLANVSGGNDAVPSVVIGLSSGVLAGTVGAIAGVFTASGPMPIGGICSLLGLSVGVVHYVYSRISRD